MITALPIARLGSRPLHSRCLNVTFCQSTASKAPKQLVLVGPDEVPVLGPLSKSPVRSSRPEDLAFTLGLRTAPQLLGRRNAFRDNVIYCPAALAPGRLAHATPSEFFVKFIYASQSWNCKYCPQMCLPPRSTGLSLF